MKGIYSLALFVLILAPSAWADSKQRYTFQIKLITDVAQEGPMTVMVDDDSPMSLTTPSGNQVHVTMKSVRKGDRELIEVSSQVDLNSGGGRASSTLPRVYLSGLGSVEIVAGSDQAEGQLKSLQLDLKAIESS